MFSILKRALSWAITSFGNKFCLKKRSRLIKALDNRFYVKFMQLEIGPFYELAFLTKCWLFQTRNPPLSLFLAFLGIVFTQFCSNTICEVAFKLKTTIITKFNAELR